MRVSILPLLFLCHLLFSKNCDGIGKLIQSSFDYLDDFFKDLKMIFFSLNSFQLAFIQKGFSNEILISNKFIYLLFFKTIPIEHSEMYLSQSKYRVLQ